MSPRGVPRPFHQRMIKFLYTLSIGLYGVTGAFIYSSNIYIAGVIGITVAILMSIQEIPNFHTKIAGSIGWTQYLIILTIAPLIPVIIYFIHKIGLIFKNKFL